MLANSKFEGELNGKRIEDFTSQLDFNIESTQKRVDKVKEILYTQGVNKEYIDNFFELFFDQTRTPKPYFNVNVGTTGYNSEFNNICKKLEHMVNYILFSEEAIKENELSEYSYLTNTNKRKIKKREVSYEQIIDKKSNTGNEQLQNKEVNRLGIKKYPKMSITKEDIEQINYISQLQYSIDKLLPKLDDEGISDEDKFKIRRLIVDLRKEQIVIKDGIRRPIEFKKLMNEKPVYDLSSDTGYYDENDNYTLISENNIDMYNPDHIYHLIEKYSTLKETSYDNFDSEIKFILWELEELVDDTELKDYEKDIIIWKIDGILAKNILWKLKEKYELEWSEPYLTKVYKNICKKVAKYAVRYYEDWFYTNKVKGEYKKCSKCGEVKLANINHFGWDKTNKRWKSQCLKCSAETKKKKRESKKATKG